MAQNDTGTQAHDSARTSNAKVAAGIDEEQVPSWAHAALDTLSEAGFQAFLVGGFVRDSLLQRPCHDIDVTTDARWEQVHDVFTRTGHEVIESGTKHGTVTVRIEGNNVEVTTFRTEGSYSDGRHPDEVRFVRDVTEDLARRDFTVNAIAWSPQVGIVDPFDGRGDLSRGLIRAVGDPATRFREDGLRVLRAVRFASKLGFEMDGATEEALSACAGELESVSAERIGVEYDGIVCGDHAVETLRRYEPVIAHVVPELAPMVDFDQRSRWHVYDVWEHCLHALELLDPQAPPIVRHATLLHDIGKPRCFTLDPAGHGHFYNHEEVGSRIARDVFRALRWRSLDIDHACLLIRVHDHHIDPSHRGVRRMLARLSRAYAGSDAITEQLFAELLQLKRADALAHAPNSISRRMGELERVEAALGEVLAEGEAFRVRDLAIGGGDVIGAGFPRGPEVGHELRSLLTLVIDGKIPNERAALLEVVHKDAGRLL